MRSTEAREPGAARMAGAGASGSAERVGSAGMGAPRAHALAERLHRGQRDPGGAILIEHIRRVALAVPGNARTVAWLHEALEYTSISEEALLDDGLSSDELRALRLLARRSESRSDAVYLRHIELIAGARGPGARLAQAVKRADLEDRGLHPAVRADGWSPPYELGLAVLLAGSTPEESGADRGTRDRRPHLAGVRR
jgi:hypothetical protein